MLLPAGCRCRALPHDGFLQQAAGAVCHGRGAAERMCSANAGRIGCGLGLSTYSSTARRKRSIAHMHSFLPHVKEAEHPKCSLGLHIRETHTHNLTGTRSPNISAQLTKHYRPVSQCLLSALNQATSVDHSPTRQYPTSGQKTSKRGLRRTEHSHRIPSASPSRVSVRAAPLLSEHSTATCWPQDFPPRGSPISRVP